ncbi:aminomethyl-transferring glycine dehydrogenase [Candidatus Palauibacter sp.]|uniref:aminomethyl-transferring glycine dehydrogenase n=1 Tax=Candidatus Palauibacter sp. TaxID=3101350 RepID=UPI003B028D88
MQLEMEPAGEFAGRHIGPAAADIEEMLDVVGVASMGELVDQTVPEMIRLGRDLELPEAVSERRLLDRAAELARLNRPHRSYLGLGYHGTLTPGVILRNIMENPGWYTQYTPYQAEISQGRLEALLNFQTMVIDLTGLPIANASLLDEGTAAAEAMLMLWGARGRGDRNVFLVSEACHPQTVQVVRGRARPLGIDVRLFRRGDLELDSPGGAFGALLQYPTTEGAAVNYRGLCEALHEHGAGVVVAADLLALALLAPPGEFGADIAVGNSQRFGVSMGYGGPHAAYLAATDAFKRKLPGRIIGVSIDADGNPALRMALQTREQHIRREKATSNICTAQVLLAIMAGMYAVYHGPKGLRAIATRVRKLTWALARGLERLGHTIVHEHFFDTLQVIPSGFTSADILSRALERRINLRDFEDGTVGITLDETVRGEDIDDLLAVFRGEGGPELTAEAVVSEASEPAYPAHLARTSGYLEHPVFNRYRSETEMLRYIHRLETRDLSLNASMIPLGSCTMKLNATSEMIPVTWPEFGSLHPFAPVEQAEGYRRLFDELEGWLCEMSGLPACSLQPNSGAQGEYTGLLVIAARHEDRGEGHRDVCLIPSSAHGTNPASAVMAGMKVVVVKCDENGNIDVDDLRAKAARHADRLAATMITYPSTHGVFESAIREVTDIVHEHGGLVYLDGANLNAQVGLCRPGDYGADVIHINLHKTFAIPHGGGGPGMGPICVTEELAPYLPGHPLVDVGGESAIPAVSSAPWGSASILLISWAYVAMLGRDGVRAATEAAVLNANYMATRLSEHFDVLYRGESGRVAHEFILDMRPLRRGTGVTDEDVAKRLMDYGFHAPTMSFPVAGTIMIEPTESESKRELDRLVDALISIRGEIRNIELGIWDKADNPLKNAPHTAAMVAADEWDHAYARQAAAYPAPSTREWKFWPPVRRVNNAHGDRNLVCACPPLESYEMAEA